jgi:hypothetical protein
MITVHSIRDGDRECVRSRIVDRDELEYVLRPR